MPENTSQTAPVSANTENKLSKKGAVVNVAKVDPETPIPLNYGENYFTTVSGQRYLPFLNGTDSYPNLVWEARLQSVTQDACITSIAQTCVGGGIYVTNVEEDKVDPQFLEFIKRVNREESLSDAVRSSIDCMETDGNSWAEIVKGSVGTAKYVRLHIHSSLVCRLAALAKDATRPDNVIRSTKFAANRNRMVSSTSLKAAIIPIYSENSLDAKTAWKLGDNKDQHTIIHLKNSCKASVHYGLQRSKANLRYQILEGKSAQFNIDNFDNNMVLSAIIAMKSPMTQDEANAAAKEIINSHTGNGKRGRIAVISSETGIEEIDVTPLATQKEGSFIEFDKRIVEKIITGNNWDAIFFGMGNEGTLGKGSGYVRAVYDVKKTTVINPICEYQLNHLINPLITIAADHFNKPEWKDYKLGFRTAMPFSYSSDINVNKVVTKNEGRDILGMVKKDGPEWELPIDANSKPVGNVPIEPTT